MSRKLLLGTLLVSVGILAVVFHHRAAPVYSRSVADFLAHPIYDQPARVQGTLVPGSLCVRRDPCEWRFRLGGGWSPPTDAAPANSPELSVRYRSCVVPETLQDLTGVDLSVTVEGELCVNCHRFEASSVFLKTYGKYEMKEMQGRGQISPEAAPPKPTPLCTGS